MRKIIGTVTIGQSPRTDVIPDIASILGPDVEIREAGALDGLSRDEIAAFCPGKRRLCPGDPPVRRFFCTGG
ncbi:MAG: hypothetical protein EOM65_17595 [Synergistales bacterium]|nr:hypothetical protein [Synergistales bacterium]